MRYFIPFAALLLPLTASAQGVRTKTHARSLWSFEASTDPTVAQHPDGRYFNADTGEALTDAQADEIGRRDGLEPDSSIVLYRSVDPYSKAWRTYGDETANVSLGRATANSTTTLRTDGVETAFENRLSALEIHGEHEYQAVSGKYGSAGVMTQADLVAGAEATSKAGLKVSNTGVAGTAGIDVGFGVRVTCEISPNAILCGLQASYTARPEANAGLYGSAGAYLKFDWTDMTLKAGGKAGATLGVGVGLEQEVEINLQALVMNHRETLDCLRNAKNEALAKAATAVEKYVTAPARERVIKLMQTLNRPPLGPAAAASVGGWNEPRRTKTVPAGHVSNSGDAGREKSAGVRR